MRSRYLLRGAAAALALAAGSTPAYAQGTATQQLLQRLYEKGILTHEEFEQIMAETNTAPAPAPAPAPASAPSPQADAQEDAAEALESSRMVRVHNGNEADSDSIAAGAILFF
jgi:hypothetical protein